MAQQGQSRAQRTYGRRKGHRLSRRRERLIDNLLPLLKLDLAKAAPEQLGALFDPARRAVWLEIGFGAGEHLAWQARQHPEVGFIGCEPFINGVAALLAAIDEQGLANVRIHDDDARDVLDWLPEASISRAFILFPDPWPKKRHQRRRLVSAGMLADLARILKLGSELRLATDDGHYASQMLQRVLRQPAFSWTARCAADWRERGADWPETRYEQKAKTQKNACYYLTFQRV